MGTLLSAGVARAVITPPIGTPMIGFAGRGPVEGIHDELTATALVLTGPAAPPASGTTGLAIIACDLLFLRASEVRAVRAAVGRLTDIPPDHVVIACSHTHYGPLTEPDRDEQAVQVAPYLANLAHALAGVVAAARATATPCRLGFGQGEVRVGINRRERTTDGRIILGQNPAGPVDPRLAVVRIDSVDGRPLAALLNYACHPVSLGSQCTEASSDYPGVARRLVEEHTGAMALFVQGAAGNINPLLMGWDWTHPVRLGLPVGAEAVRVYWSATPSGDLSAGGLRATHDTLQLPPLLPTSIEAGRDLVAALEQERARLAADGTDGARWWSQVRLGRARQGLATLEGTATAPSLSAEVAALRLSQEIGLVTAPGEIFTEIGQSIVARSPFRHTLYAGYTNGTIGYVPTRAAYAEGGYEVTHACQVAPEGGEHLEAASLDLLAHAYGTA